MEYTTNKDIKAGDVVVFQEWRDKLHNKYQGIATEDAYLEDGELFVLLTDITAENGVSINSYLDGNNHYAVFDVERGYWMSGEL